MAVARERIDLRSHEGVHPRVGAADVVPLVPIRPEAMARARGGGAGRRRADRRASSGCRCSSTASSAPGRGPAFFRRGGPEALQRRVDSGELAPDFGPARLTRRAGAVLVGARRPLIAFNVNLRGALEAAKEIAALVRETGGGFPGVRALGLELPRPASSR